MDVKGRNKISANIKYLSECANIIYTKIRAIGNSFSEENNNNQQQMVINVEDYKHGTISITIKDAVIKICLDGTNYEVLFKKYNNGFKFYNKKLGIEYTYTDTKLDDIVHLKEIIRIIGGQLDYFKYTSIDDFICVLKYASKDEDGWQSIERYVVDDSNIQELIEYTKQKKQDEYNIDIQDLYYDIKNPEFIEALKKKQEQEIRSQIESYTSGDYSVIEFPLPDSFIYQISSKPYSCVLPDEVQHFDEGEYLRRVLEEEKNAEKRLSHEIHSCGKDAENFESDEELEPDEDSEYNNSGYEDLDYDESDFEIDGDSEYSDFDENDSDCEDYKITYSSKEEPISEEDIIYIATAETLDVQDEISDIEELYEDIKNFAEKVKKIIRGRKRKLASQNNSFEDVNRKNSNNTEFDKDI